MIKDVASGDQVTKRKCSKLKKETEVVVRFIMEKKNLHNEIKEIAKVTSSALREFNLVRFTGRSMLTAVSNGDVANVA